MPSLHRPALAAIAALAAASSLASTASAKPSVPASAVSACFSHFAAGSGDTYIGACVGARGNLVSLESAPGVNHLGAEGGEGYVVCDGIGTTHGYDVDTYGASGFGPATVAQPNGPNTFPLTITRTTTDGIFRLTQKYALEAANRDVKITMVVKNITGAVRTGVQVFREADLDVGGSSADDVFAATWRTLFALPSNSTHDDAVLVDSVGANYAVAYVNSFAAWNGVAKSTCTPSATAGPTAPGDYAGSMGFSLNTLQPGGSGTANVRYAIR
jgi:hypothetical protein